MKIDAQRKEKDTITRRLTNKYISDLNLLQNNTPTPIKQARASLAVPMSFISNNKNDHEEFELIENNETI